MAEYKLDSSVDNNKNFLVDYSSIEGRVDPFFHIPDIARIDDRLKELGAKPLRYYTKIASGGVTPKTTESEKYYTSVDDGVPFIRVQNLSPSGNLLLDDVKYINQETHQGLLKRSQVAEGDLLIKITGVGRMAVASVAPEGFVGNINQHIVVIKTGDKKLSECIATYLNTDIGEKLASKRATGGTRPALDYKALLSIPILLDSKILALSKKAYQQKQQKEQKAKELLASIDSYLLDKLGIELPEKDNSLQARIFTTNFSEVSGARFDVQDIKNRFLKIEGGIFKNIFLKDLCNIKKGQSITSGNIEDGEYPVIAGGKTSPYNHKYFNYNQEVMTVSASGAYAGYVWYHDYPIFASDCSVLWSKDEQIISNRYLFEILKLKQEDIYCLQQGAGQPHVYASDLINVKIPLPPLTPAQAKDGEISQQEIVEHILAIRAEAKQLQEEAIADLEATKAEIEKMILG